MKKITLALTLFLVAGLVAVSAQMDATVSGSATSTIGIDLDSSGDVAFGIVNSAKSDVSLTVSSGDASTEAAGGWYGEVSLTGMKIAFDHAGGADFVNDIVGTDTNSDTDEYPDEDISFSTADSGLIVTAPSVTAKITNGSISVQIWSLDSFKVDAAAVVEDDKSDISVEGEDTGLSVDLSDGTGGVTFGMPAGPANIKVHFATATGYDGADSADNADFLVGADVDLAAGPANIGLQVARGIGSDEVLGIGVTTSIAAGPLTVGVASDLQQSTGAFDWEVRLDTGVSMGGIGADLDLFYGDDLDVEISSSPSFGPLELSVLIGLYDLTGGSLGWGVDVGTTFTLNEMIKIGLDAAYDSAGVVPLKLKATISDPIPNVDVVAQWTSSDVVNDLGLFTIATTIAY